MKIYVVFAKSKKDEFLIIGCYDSQEKALFSQNEFNKKHKDMCLVVGYDVFELNKIND